MKKQKRGKSNSEWKIIENKTSSFGLSENKTTKIHKSLSRPRKK
jgi:hypothetical protein